MESETTQNGISVNHQITWTRMNGDSIAAREGHCSCTTNNKMFLFGGVMQTSDNVQDLVETNELLQFSCESKKWQKVAVKGELPAPRSAASLVAVGKHLYLFGGLSHMTGWFSDLYEFNTDTCTWSLVQVEGSGPSARDKLQGVAVGNNIYYFGGFGPKLADADMDEEWEDEDDDDDDEIPADQEGAEFGWFNDLFMFDTVNRKWSQPLQLNLGVPTARAAHSLCAVGNKLVVFGGRDSEKRQDDIHIFDTESKKWDMELNPKGLKPKPRSFHAAASVGHKVIVTGGRGTEDQHFDDFHIFDCDTNTWSQPAQKGDVSDGRGQHALGVIENTLVMFGGTSNFSAEIMHCQNFHTDTFTANIDMMNTSTQTNGHGS